MADVPRAAVGDIRTQHAVDSFGDDELGHLASRVAAEARGRSVTVTGLAGVSCGAQWREAAAFAGVRR
jgi:hypothetical protein